MASREMGVPEAQQLGRKLFGDKLNAFEQRGLWFVGKFLDDERADRPPHRRRQEIYGCGETLGEAFAFFLGPGRVYSIAGMQPGSLRLEGWRPRVDSYGRIIGWTSRAGVFSPGFRFPGRAAAQA